MKPLKVCGELEAMENREKIPPPPSILGRNNTLKKLFLYQLSATDKTRQNNQTEPWTSIFSILILPDEQLFNYIFWVLNAPEQNKTLQLFVNFKRQDSNSI